MIQSFTCLKGTLRCKENEMSTVKFTEHAVLMCHLAEYQDNLDAEVDQATIEYLGAQRIAKDKLQRLRDAIDLRDAMSKARKYVGGEK